MSLTLPRRPYFVLFPIRSVKLYDTFGYIFEVQLSFGHFLALLFRYDTSTIALRNYETLKHFRHNAAPILPAQGALWGLCPLYWEKGWKCALQRVCWGAGDKGYTCYVTSVNWLQSEREESLLHFLKLWRFCKCISIPFTKTDWKILCARRAVQG